MSVEPSTARRSVSGPRPGHWRHLLLGDWSPIVRDPIDLLRLIFLVAAIVLLVIGDRENALRMALTFGLVVLARVVDAPRVFDLLFVLGMGLQAFGNATDLFFAVSWYDKVVHIVLSFGTAPLFYLLLIRLEAVRELRDTPAGWRGPLAIVIITLGLGTAFGALYEVYEYVVVHAFDAHLQIGYGDTINDIIGDAFASLAGGGLLVLWARHGWGSSRRLPGPPDHR